MDKGAGDLRVNRIGYANAKDSLIIFVGIRECIGVEVACDIGVDLFIQEFPGPPPREKRLVVFSGETLEISLEFGMKRVGLAHLEELFPHVSLGTKGVEVGAGLGPIHMAGLVFENLAAF